MAERESRSPPTAGQRADIKRRRRFDADTGWVLSDERGRRFVEEFRVASGIGENIIPGPMMEYRLGRRSLGLDLTEQVRRVGGPAVLVTMELERDAAVKIERHAAEAECQPSGDEGGEG